MKKKAVDDHVLRLKESNFEIMDRNKAEKNIEYVATEAKKLKPSLIIEEIHCCGKTKSESDEDDGKYQTGEHVVIKVRSKENRVYMVQYCLDTDEEVTWLSGPAESDIFHNTKNEFIVANNELGLINLTTKEMLLEYHVQNIAGRSEMMKDQRNKLK